MVWLWLAASSVAGDWRGLDVEEREMLASEARIALVIGNANYTVGALANPVRDAEAMAVRLADLGFDVDLGTNLGRTDMMAAIRVFGKRLEAGGTGVFYFAGHGLQVDGVNFMIPVDAEIQEEAHVEAESVPVDLVLGRMEGADNRLNILILDACRNNPYERGWRSVGRGLSGMDAPSGSLIAFATAPGTLAGDGTMGGHGLYTGALLDHIGTPGLDLEDTFKQVRAQVAKLTDDAQVPQEYTSITGDFFFAIPPDDEIATTESDGTATTPTVRPGEVNRTMDFVGGARALTRDNWRDDAPIFGVGFGVPFLTLTVDAPRVRWFGRIGASLFVGPGLSFDSNAAHGSPVDENGTYNASIVAGLKITNRVALGPAAAMTFGFALTHPVVRQDAGFLPGAGGTVALDLRLTNVLYLDIGATFTYDQSAWAWPTVGLSTRFGKKDRNP